MGVGTVTLMNRFFKQFDVNPLDIDKLTLASYSGYLLQHYLMRNKRIGQFSPNILPMYGCLKSAATGGLTVVTRHSADTTDESELPINSHICEEHTIKPAGICMLDVSSLYPSSCLFDLPFGPGYFSVRCNARNNILNINVLDKYDNNLFNSHESQVVQYLSLVRYPQALRIFSTFHAGEKQMVFGGSFKKRVDLTIVMEPGNLKVIQYHDSQSHLVDKGAHTTSCKKYRQKNLDFDYATSISDDQNNRYAEHMTNNVSGLKISYEVVNECEFFHGNPLKEAPKYNSPMEYLKKNFRNESVFKPTWLNGENITTDFILDKIINSDECENGFIVVEKGACENANDEVTKLFGFCLQRNSPDPQELGPDAYDLARNFVKKDMALRKGETEGEFYDRLTESAEKYMNKRVNATFTMTRKSFKNDQCLPVSYFKWLVKNRNILPSVKVLHYIHYEGRSYAQPFIYKLLQARHDLIISNKKKSLDAAIYKLLANSLYGQFMMEKNKYHTYTYATESHLRKNPPEKATSVNLISAIPTKKSSYLYYHVKWLQSTAKITNLLQVGATILGYSRTIFYNQIYTILSLLDSKKAELCYIDTDSMALLVSSPQLRDCVKPGKEDIFDKQTKSMFINPHSEKTQAGRLKLEGYYQSAFFRCVKSYVLNPFPHLSDERIVKSKGIASVVRKQIPDKCFEVSPRKRENVENDTSNQEDMFFQNMHLYPTMGEQIFLSIKRRKLSNPINCKRVMKVSSANCNNKMYKIFKKGSFLSFQNKCHTLPLE